MALTYRVENWNDMIKMKEYFLDKGQIRNHLYFVLDAETILRVGDIRILKLVDIYDFEKNRIRKYLIKTHQKTDKKQTIFLNAIVREAIEMYLAILPPKHFYPERFILTPLTGKYRNENRPMRYEQLWKIMKHAADYLDIDCINFATHSFRKTKLHYYVYYGPIIENQRPQTERRGRNPRIILFHTFGTTSDIYMDEYQEIWNEFFSWKFLDRKTMIESGYKIRK